jgi:hypothetical protein
VPSGYLRQRSFAQQNHTVLKAEDLVHQGAHMTEEHLEIQGAGDLGRYGLNDLDYVGVAAVLFGERIDRRPLRRIA